MRHPLQPMRQAVWWWLFSISIALGSPSALAERTHCLAIADPFSTIELVHGETLPHPRLTIADDVWFDDVLARVPSTWFLRRRLARALNIGSGLPFRPLSLAIESAARKGAQTVSLRSLGPGVMQETSGGPNGWMPLEGNCFNGVLRWHGIEAERGVTDEVTLERALRSFFAPINLGATPRYGDLAVYRERNGRPLHATVVLDRTTTWEMRSISSLDGYTFTPLDQPLNTYRHTVSEVSRTFYRRVR